MKTFYASLLFTAAGFWFSNEVWAQSQTDVSKPVSSQIPNVSLEALKANFNKFKQAIRPVYDEAPRHSFKVTYTTFRKKTNDAGEPLVKFKGEYHVDPTKPEGQRVTQLSISKPKIPTLIKDNLEELETSDIGESFYCSVDREIMDSIEAIDDPAELEFTLIPSLPGQISFSFPFPETLVLSEDEEGNSLDENDAVMAQIIAHAGLEFNLKENDYQPVSIRAFIDEPFSVYGVLRLRALDAVATCGVTNDGTLYAKEVLSFARMRVFGIGQRIHQVRTIEIIEKQ